MTNEERDRMILETHDTVITVIPMIKNHEATLYGNGKPGLKQDFATHVEAEKWCPARLAASDERKKTNIAVIAVVVSGISLLCTMILVVISVYRLGIKP